MSFAFLKPEELKTKYDEAKESFRPNFDDFADNERIANAEPKYIAEGQPNVTDATTASYIETRPRAIVQKAPTGKVTLFSVEQDPDRLSELRRAEEIMGELIDNVILPHATTGGSLLSKTIAVVRNGLIYGSQPVLCFVRNDDNYFGADFQLLNIRDVYFENGKTDVKDCNYLFVTAYYTKGDIEAIIANELELAEDEDYQMEWDIETLRNLKDKLSGKDNDSLSYIETSLENHDSVYVKLVHAFQRGIGQKFYTFDPETGDVVREWKNPDPRGSIPVQYFYYQQDNIHPLGVSAIRLTKRQQDMLDMHLQNYQYAVGMKAAPPVKIRGNVDFSNIKFEPYSIWNMGSDPNADVSVVQTDNTIINTFPTVQGILKGNILNITNNGDTSISATYGNPGFSKTAAGVKVQQQRVDVNDNYLRRQFEDFYGELLTTMLNLHISAHANARIKDVVPLSRRYIEMKKLQDYTYDLVTDELDYLALGAVIANFRVDASSSKIDDDQEQLECLNQLLELRIKAGEGIEPYLKLAPLVRQIVKKSGVENIDEISPREAEDQTGKTLNTSEDVNANMQMIPPSSEAISQEPSMHLAPGVVPHALASPAPLLLEDTPESIPLTDSKQPAASTPESPMPNTETELIANLVQNHIPVAKIPQVLEALKSGADPVKMDELLGEKHE